MKKLLLGGFVGGLLIFIWQTISWTALPLHKVEYQKANNQDSIIQFLSSQFTSTGQYMIPRADENATAEEMEKAQQDLQGKPWAVVSYHSAYTTDMTNNILRGLITSIIAALFVCWVVMKQANATCSTTALSTVLIGIAGYLFIPYSQHIWFETPDATSNFIDTIVAWSLCGIWLGWWLNKK